MAYKVRGITIEIGGDTSQLQKSLSDVDKQLSSTKGILKDVNKLLKLDPSNVELLRQKQKALKDAIAQTSQRLEELKKISKDSVKPEEWEAIQREIIATESNLENLKKQLKDFGSVGAQQLAAAGQKMEDFGSKVEAAGKKMQPLSTAATGLVASLVGLGYKAVTSADDLNTLSKQTGISTDELQKMKYASDLVDVSFDDMTGAVSKLKKSMTGHDDTWSRLGVSVTNVDGSMRNATDVFKDALVALSDIENETERDQLAMDIFGKSSDSLAGIIDDGGAALEQYGKEAEDLGLILSGDTLDALNETNDALDKSKAQLGAAFGELGATVAQTLAPMVEKLSKFVEKVTQKLKKLTPEQTKIALKVTAVVAAVAPLVTGIGKVITTVGKVMKVGAKVSTLLTGLNPVVLGVAAAITAAVAVGVLMYKNWDKIKDTAKNLKEGIVNAWNNIKTGVSKAADGVKSAVTKAWDNVKSASSTAWEAVKKTATDKFTAIKTSFESAGGGIKGVASATITAVKEYWTAGFDLINNLTGGKLDSFKTAVSNAWNNVKSTVSTIASNIGTSVSTAWTNMKTNVTNTVAALKTGVLNAWDGLKSGISAKVSNVKSYVDQIKTKFSDAKDHISNVIQKIKDAFNFNWSFPHIKLPHFKVYGGVSPYGLGGKGELPKISIEWYKKAYQNPVMFTQPTVLQTAAGAKGFGDGHGAEIVMGLNKLRELVGTSENNVTINVYAPEGMDVNQLAEQIQDRFVALQQQRSLAYA